jgi:hypothetical protein
MGSRLKVLLAVFGFGLLAMPAWAQNSAPTLNDAIAGYESAAHQSFQGLATDWSSHHVVYSKPAPGSDTESTILQDSRYWAQQIRRSQAESDVSAEPDADDAQADVASQSDFANKAKGKKSKGKKHKNTLKRDWSVNLGTGATVGDEMYPATFTAGASVSCTNDFAVYNTTLAGSATHPSIAAFVNIYSSCAGSPPPTTFWSYNTGGTIVTSPVLSSDGKQVAFVQTVGGTTANLVLLKWKASTGTLAAPATPTAVTAANYRTCTTPCMTSFAFSGAPNDTNSAPFYTSNSEESIYVGDNAGKLHKFINLFSISTPEEVQTRTVTDGHTTNGSAVITSATAIFSPSDVGDSVTVTNFVAGTKILTFTSPTQVTLTNNASGTTMTASVAITSPWPVTVHNATVLSSPVADSNTRNIFVGDAGGQLSYVRDLGSTTGACSPLPCLGTTTIAQGGSIVDGPLLDVSTQRVFWFNGLAVSGANNGIVEQTDETLASPQILTGVGGSGVGSNMHAGAFDNTYFNSSSPSIAGFLYLCGKRNTNRDHPSLYRVGFSGTGVMNTTPDGGANAFLVELATPSGEECSPVTELNNNGTDRLFVSVQNNNTAAQCLAGGCITSFIVTNWQKTTAYPLNFQIVDTNHHLETVTTAGTSGGSQPAWPGGTGSVTVDGTVHWTSALYTSNSGLDESGGTSGIVVDNVLGSGGSQVYFTPLADQACTTGGTGGCAIQASQAGLN